MVGGEFGIGVLVGEGCGEFNSGAFSWDACMLTFILHSQAIMPFMRFINNFLFGSSTKYIMANQGTNVFFNLLRSNGLGSPPSCQLSKRTLVRTLVIIEKWNKLNDTDVHPFMIFGGKISCRLHIYMQAIEPNNATKWLYFTCYGCWHIHRFHPIFPPDTGKHLNWDYHIKQNSNRKPHTLRGVVLQKQISYLYPIFL